MSINESIWGSSDTWIDYYAGSVPYIDVKIASDTHASLGAEYGYSGVESPDIDLSVSPWGIGGGSWLCHTFCGSAWHQFAEDQNPYNAPLGFNKIAFECDKNAGKQHPMIFLSRLTPDNSTIARYEDGRLSACCRYYPKPNADANSYLGKQSLYFDDRNACGFDVKPVLQFDYKNMILIPYVCGVDPNGYHRIMFLDDFCNNISDPSAWDNIAGWKNNNVHLVGIGYMFANGAAGSRNTYDDSYKSFNIATIRALGEFPMKDNGTYPYASAANNKPQPMGNIPGEAYHCSPGGYYGSSGVMFRNSTMISQPGQGTIQMYSQASYGEQGASPFTYWYDGRAEERGNKYEESCAEYWTGGEDWEFICRLMNLDYSQTLPYIGSYAYRYMRWNWDSLTDDEIKTELWKQVAFLGFCFTTDHTKINGEVGIDNELCMPMFSNGVTTGSYKYGTAAQELENYTWTTDIWDKNNYNPYQQEGDNQEDYGNLSNVGTYTHFPASLRVLEISLDKMLDTITVLNQLYVNDTSGVEKWELDFKGANPSDYIVGLYGTVVNLAHVSDTPTPIKIGNITLTDYDTTLNGYSIDTTTTGRFSCGSVYIPEYYGDFRDYGPYTTIELYLPLCGTVELDPAFVVGHSIHVVYYIDVLTMSCTTSVYRDGITLIKTVDGVCGASIPLTAARMGDYQNQVHALETAHKQNEIRIATSAISVAAGAAALLAAPPTGGASLVAAAGVIGGIGGVMGAVNTDAQNRYQLDHIKPSINQTGAAEAQNAFNVGSLYPFLFIKRAKMLTGYDEQVYSHTVGNACCENRLIGDMNGFTVATNIDTTGIAATADEVKAIKEYFANGVYI